MPSHDSEEIQALSLDYKVPYTTAAYEKRDSLVVMLRDTRFHRGIKSPLKHKPAKPHERAKRGSITKFSDKSRRKALVTLRNGPHWSTFVTLTFPYRVNDGKVAKRPLDRLVKRLVRLGISAYWSLEFHRNGNPHFHLLLTRHVSRKELHAMWAGCLGHVGHIHVHASRVRSQERVIYYAVKRKGHWSRVVPEGFSNLGQFWSMCGPDAKAVALLTIEGPRKVVAKVWRFLRLLEWSYARRLAKRRRADKGFVGRLLWDLGGQMIANTLRQLAGSLGLLGNGFPNAAQGSGNPFPHAKDAGPEQSGEAWKTA